jgi:RNA recognition motif-containing protein
MRCRVFNFSIYSPHFSLKADTHSFNLKDNMNIFVGNLSHEVNENELQQEFEKYGKVTKVTIIRDMFTRNSKGFGFVEMPSKTEAEAAIQGMRGHSIKGRGITVNEARPPRDKNKRGRRR